MATRQRSRRPPGGCSLQDADYLKFILDLTSQGFEISLHNVRNHDSTREMIKHGLEEFLRLMGRYPRVQTNHSTNRDNFYWGAARFNKLSLLYRAARRCGTDIILKGMILTHHFSGGPLP